MALTFGAALLIAFLAAIFRSEFEAWMPWIAERLRRLALRPFKGALRERLDEEWSAYLDEVPGNVGKVFCALGFNVASRVILVRRLARLRRTNRLAGLRRTAEQLFPERHLYVRSGRGMQKYVLSSKRQVMMAAVGAGVAVWSVIATAGILLEALGRL